jgi:hypothetical protein
MYKNQTVLSSLFFYRDCTYCVLVLEILLMFILVKHALLCQRLCRNQCQPSLQKNDKLMLLLQPALQRSTLLDSTRFIRFFDQEEARRTSLTCRRHFAQGVWNSLRTSRSSMKRLIDGDFLGKFIMVVHEIQGLPSQNGPTYCTRTRQALSSLFSYSGYPHCVVLLVIFLNLHLWAHVPSGFPHKM